MTAFKMIIAILAIASGSSAIAAECTVTRGVSPETTQIVSGVDFNVVTHSESSDRSSIDFRMVRKRMSPDAFWEFVEVISPAVRNCEKDDLFHDNLYAGVRTACVDPAITIECRF